MKPPATSWGGPSWSSGRPEPVADSKPLKKAPCDPAGPLPSPPHLARKLWPTAGWGMAAVQTAQRWPVGPIPTRLIPGTVQLVIQVKGKVGGGQQLEVARRCRMRHPFLSVPFGPRERDRPQVAFERPMPHAGGSWCPGKPRQPGALSRPVNLETQSQGPQRDGAGGPVDEAKR